MQRSRKNLKKSKPSHNMEGRTEKELHQQAHYEKGPNNKLKKRQRRDLEPDEIEAIVAATKKPFHRYKDVAEQFRISLQLVSILVQESKKNPEKVQQLRSRNQKAQRKREAVEHTVSYMLWNNKPIYSISQVQTELQSQSQLEVEKPLVRQVMRKDLRLGYRMAKTVTI